MNLMEYDAKRQRNIELLVLILCTCYTIGFSIMIAINQWGSWEQITIVVFIVVAWMFYAFSFKDYLFRACLTFGMLQLSLVLYSLRLDGVMESLTTMISISVVVLLYAIPELVFISLIANSFEILYHIFITKQIAFHGEMEDCRKLFLILAVYVVQFVIYYTLIRQSEMGQVKERRIEKLQAAEQSKDDFLANVSHELRTPINTICGMSETVLREDIPENIRENIFYIQNAGRHLSSVVSDILDFSEMQADNVELVETEYHISSLVNDMISMGVSLKDKKNIEFIVELDADMPSVLIGDEQKLRRVILNLLSNAIKFTPEGCVSLLVSHRKEQYGANLTVTVKDTGIGMKPDQMENIFTMFSQIDSKRNRQEGGIGLGLAISRAIVTKMGGVISVKSDYGKGTDIRFTVPQKVANARPVAVLEHTDTINPAVYINMEQFAIIEIRDEYSASIRKMIEELHVGCHVCQNLPELKRRWKREYLTHVIISTAEYLEDPIFFDQLSEKTRVCVILDRWDDGRITNPKLCKIYKPFYVLPIVRALNGEEAVWGRGMSHVGAFTAPTAKILAVDDNLMNLKVLENLLAPYELQVVSVTSGPEALETIASMDYDLVFLDHMMPEMDGIETLQRIRNKNGQYFKNVPIVALTANAVSGMREMFLKEGFDDFVSKPVELSVLDRVLQKYIPQTKLRRKDAPTEEKETPAAVPEDEYRLQDISLQKGVRYCGSLEGYASILKLHCRDGKKTREKLQQLFAAQNWKEYEINVHALKSSMMSIGAESLSDMARELEMAARKHNYDYILSSHDALMREYDRVLCILRDSPLTAGVSAEETEQPKKAEEQKLLTELSEEDFGRLTSEFEDAVYDLDDERIKTIVKELSGHLYKGHDLDEEMELVRRKVDMEDYMSALDTLLAWKEKLV